MMFDFESDFAGSLRCIPMIARQKLDIGGIKLSLKQWSRLSREERGRLADLPYGTRDEQDSYRRLVSDLIATRTDEPTRYLAMQGLEDWQETDLMSDAVRLQAAADGVSPPTQEEWAELTPLQRFALIKMACSQHENENFVPAMKEFGIL